MHDGDEKNEMRTQNRIAIISIMIITMIMLGSQNVKAVIDIDEDNVKRIGVEYAKSCHQMIVLLGLGETSRTTNEKMLLAQCDNDMLIYKLDICPNHDYNFPVCHEEVLFQYIVERGLDSVT